MSAFRAVVFRELRAVFCSPLAYVFLAVYLLVSGLLTWNLARFFDTAIADLTPFFQFQPWLVALFLPAIGMRFWSEDLRARTSDLYITAPCPLYLVHAAKLMAAWAVLLIALLATAPYWIMVNYLGSPDNGLIFFNYLLLACFGFLVLTIVLAFSAMTTHQVIAFVLAAMTTLVLLTIGLPAVTGQLSAILPDMLAGWLHGYSLFGIFEKASRGQVIFSDLVFLALLAAFFFVLALALLTGRKRLGAKAGFPWHMAMLLCVFALLPVMRFDVQKMSGRAQLDVTAERINSLSPAARQLAKTLAEPIELRFFYSESIGRDYPEIRAHAERVKGLLSAFEKASDGQISLTVFDPTPFSIDEDIAITNGIRSVPTEGVDPLYLGLSGENTIDDLIAISFLNPERASELEFDIAGLIAELDHPEKPHIAILSGASDIQPDSAGASYLLKALEADYLVDWLSPDEPALPETVEALLLIAPPDLPAHTVWLIDQFLLRQGRLIILSDPASLVSGAPPIPDWLNDLLASHGAKFSAQILGDVSLGLPVSVSGAGGNRVETQPLYLAPGMAQMNREDFLVSGLKRPVNFGAPGWVEAAGAEAAALINSSDAALKVAPDDLARTEFTPARIRAIGEPLAGAKTIAARLTGQFRTIFPDGEPEPSLPDDPVLRRLAEARLQHLPHISYSESKGEIVLIADTDFLMNAFYVSLQTGEAIADNAALMLGILDQFAGRPELAALRSRPSGFRPMTRILDMRRAAEAEYLEEQARLEADMAALQNNLAQGDAGQRAAYLETRGDLRKLQRAFRSRINALEAWLRAWTIWIPFGLSILAGLFVYWRERRAA